MKRCFPPIINKSSAVLILGSFPGEESLRKQEYYGHPRNQFWKLIGKIVGEELHGKPYGQKKKLLLKHHIALWDVIFCCERRGSLDCNIKNAELNNLKKMGVMAPNIKLVCFNGQTAAKCAPLIKNLGYQTAVLPSSSPANTNSFSEKLKVWKKGIKPFVR